VKKCSRIDPRQSLEAVNPLTHLHESAAELCAQVLLLVDRHGVYGADAGGAPLVLVDDDTVLEGRSVPLVPLVLLADLRSFYLALKVGVTAERKRLHRAEKVTQSTKSYTEGYTEQKRLHRAEKVTQSTKGYTEHKRLHRAQKVTQSIYVYIYIYIHG
jgi:hypothetical protein